MRQLVKPYPSIHSGLTARVYLFRWPPPPHHTIWSSPANLSTIQIKQIINKTDNKNWCATIYAINHSPNFHNLSHMHAACSMIPSTDSINETSQSINDLSKYASVCLVLLVGVQTV